MLSLGLAGLRLLMSAEIDCADEEKKYVELKTSKQIASQRDSASFEKFKLLKFWLQSFLAGVPRVLVGFRRAYRRRDKVVATGFAKFLAHLCNHQVAHELVALQLLTVLLDDPTDDSVTTFGSRPAIAAFTSSSISMMIE